jgi:glycosyltransferase involved in cell wall biosynthesis
MHITMVDDSIAFDGYSPGNRPLGGAEKAFASLASALARRGHDVYAYNRARYPLAIEGVHWETLGRSFPAQTDALIAWRKPSLLGSVRLAGRRILWTTATGPQLQAARKSIESFSPIVVLNSVIQAEGVKGSEAMPLRLVAPGVRDEFASDLPTLLSDAPTAVVTSHPSHGLSALLVLWKEQIHPRVPEARLLVVSASLEKAQRTGEVPEALVSLVAQVRMAEDDGVVVVPPRGDAGMAEIYRSARVHLYPGHAEDMICWTLLDSQACGLPAVVRPLGGTRERIRDGQTGQLVPDEAALVNLTVRLLTDEDTFWGMSRDARLLQRERSWDVAAAEFDALLRAGDKT